MPGRAAGAARGKAAPRRLAKGARVAAAQASPRPLWLYLNGNTVMHCNSCARAFSVGPLEVWADPAAIRAGKVEYTCDCGGVFDLEDFIVAGAKLVAGVEGL